MISIILNTSEIDETIDHLTGMSFDPFFRDSGKYIENQIAERLSKGVDIAGEPFVPLKKKYAERKGKAGYGSKPILTATGDLGRALFTDMLADDESLTTVFGIHRIIPRLSKSMEAMTSIVQRLETGDSPLAGPREMLGMDDQDAEWILQRLGTMFEPEFS